MKLGVSDPFKLCIYVKKNTWSANAVKNKVISSFSATCLHNVDQCQSNRSFFKLINMTPVLNPLPNAGQGLCPFQSFPGMYQSLWFSTNPNAASVSLNFRKSFHN